MIKAIEDKKLKCNMLVNMFNSDYIYPYPLFDWETPLGDQAVLHANVVVEKGGKR